MNKPPIKNITIETVEWPPDNLYPEGGFACDVKIVRGDGSREILSTRMCRTITDAWSAAERLKKKALERVP
jgi:hypothetical protein